MIIFEKGRQGHTVYLPPQTFQCAGEGATSQENLDIAVRGQLQTKKFEKININRCGQADGVTKHAELKYGLIFGVRTPTACYF